MSKYKKMPKYNNNYKDIIHMSKNELVIEILYTFHAWEYKDAIFTDGVYDLEETRRWWQCICKERYYFSPNEGEIIGWHEIAA